MTSYKVWIYTQSLSNLDFSALTKSQEPLSGHEIQHYIPASLEFVGQGSAIAITHHILRELGGSEKNVKVFISEQSGF